MEVWLTQIRRHILNEPRIACRSECHPITSDLNDILVPSADRLLGADIQDLAM